VSLRPEMTPSLARMVMAKRNGLVLPLKWFSIPQCWRYERMTRGRCVGSCLAGAGKRAEASGRGGGRSDHVMAMTHAHGISLCESQGHHCASHILLTQSQAAGALPVEHGHLGCARRRYEPSDSLLRIYDSPVANLRFPSAGDRRREHYQWNMDIWGVGSVRAEAELLAAVTDFFRRVGLTPDDVGTWRG
jgi:hypothetical protein